ncbi:Soluble lytic murein transglycosylase or regulatory protein s (may contain LysM/invasin domain) (MltE) (PDB:153L) [Commensalibacter communis]|uniref:Soluble lytic murein transglycosylase or regulatory protein s ( may contain LysM/invasin domain) (MltE) n=1 Tax=Commensalibacter communis TaxID=2972786 RepID=A0A9W4TKW2_9PROT|nr:lytic transglycosylase domain-containing protein [Commensalibacter communis]CAI3922138.1 Soluble lytic murein transglycosylase or regulatory protein s (may contain LysM/invasin domain) (MltE) (PDB:153L) [Commensalibacter communis]CAI3922662.1 Soluble lytic murein transglycosylase or regulatory protein s (may contain LysM/invasin domain) (MltE) (PDB:153L) [Commensalibacter communis]CAI3932264.1 Soluble lytic murein transglycosylase or regulatory protein s (may contain LysM/invasin domain) (Mlt
MQGIYSISPSVVRALVASATLLAGVSASTIRAQTPQQQDQYEEATITTTRPSSSGSNGSIRFPRPLDALDARRIRHIFDLQRQGDFKTAQSETIAISDNLLLGDILAERYLNPQFTPNTGQLRLWLKNFPTYADSPEIIKRLNSLNTTNTPIPMDHAFPVLKADVKQASLPMPTETDPIVTPFKRNPLLDKTIYTRSTLGIKGATSALHLIKKTSGMTDLYAAQLQAEIAQQLFSIGKDEDALRIAQQAFSLSKGRVGLAGYIAGLIAWKQNNNDLAFYLFSKASHADITASHIQAGCFFWAARTRLQAHDPNGYQTWLRKAANAPLTFYGILAQETLEKDKQNLSKPSSSNDTASNADVSAVEDTPFGKRFFALLQVGQRERAEIVLRQLWMQSNHNIALSRSIQLIAEAADFETLSNQLKTILTHHEEAVKSNVALPLPTLKPRHGFKMNPALVYALTRLESNFNSKAISQNGAMGLMQIMPVTAQYIAKKQDNVSLNYPSELKNAALNLEIGQLYLEHLAKLSNKKDNQGGNLLHMLASYNAGPSMINKWLDITDHQHDPLLFMETIPVTETRHYLHRALTYLWIYSKELDLPRPSLNSLVKNEWPCFENERHIMKSVTIH